ncbi:hypothetical protein [Streptomyces sp. NPDC048282]|uniref:hypothetical protein n=1 Tax=Streptomyces sp. NPDC048282 TaxID=3365528 RepID=UPI00371FFF0B
MTTRFDDEPDFDAPDDPLAVLLRPPAAHLGPPQGRYEEIRRAAGRRRLIRTAVGAGATCAVAAFVALSLHLTAPAAAPSPRVPLAPPAVSPTAPAPSRPPASPAPDTLAPSPSPSVAPTRSRSAQAPTRGASTTPSAARDLPSDGLPSAVATESRP